MFIYILNAYLVEPVVFMIHISTLIHVNQHDLMAIEEIQLIIDKI